MALCAQLPASWLTCCWAGPPSYHAWLLLDTHTHKHKTDHTDTCNDVRTQIAYAHFQMNAQRVGENGIEEQVNIPQTAVWTRFSFSVSTVTQVSHAVHSGNVGHLLLLGAGNRLKHCNDSVAGREGVSPANGSKHSVSHFPQFPSSLEYHPFALSPHLSLLTSKNRHLFKN